MSCIPLPTYPHIIRMSVILYTNFMTNEILQYYSRGHLIQHSVVRLVTVELTEA